MDYINLIGLIIAFIGSIILCVALIKSKSVIRGMAATTWDSNPIAEKEYYKDRKLGIIGVGFLLSGFLAQIVGNILHIAGYVN